MDIPDPKDRREWTKQKIANGQKKIVVGTMNILLHKYLGEDYKKSFLKKEPYVLANDKFQTAVTSARKNLHLDTEDGIPTDWKDFYRPGGRSPNLEDTKEFENFRNMYTSEVERVIKLSNLTADWHDYVTSYILNSSAPENPLFMIPKTIRVIDMEEDGSITIKIKPGIRYSDYISAWKVFVRHLGEGNRLEKPYTNTNSNLIYQDKVAGMTYAELAKKYFPSNAEASIDKIKKIVSREKIRRSQDK